MFGGTHGTSHPAFGLTFKILPQCLLFISHRKPEMSEQATNADVSYKNILQQTID
jgi:hypothetical protein